MLVYANYLNMEGQDAPECIFKSVGVWTKEQLGFGLHPEQLRDDGEYQGNRNGVRSWLRISVSNEEDPQFYSWTLKVADQEVRGRQWVTELGLKIDADECVFSCVLRTEESSALVSHLVAASRPRVMRYVVAHIERAQDAHFRSLTPGSRPRQVGDSSDSYRALLTDVERIERDYPIVLISPDRDGEYLVDPSRLQTHLVGLAQVVRIDPDYDSYEMEKVLGRSWSAWDGAINLLHTPSSTGFVRPRLFLSDEITTWGDQNSRFARILAWVTNNTNIPRMRQRVRPEGIDQLKLRRKLQTARARSSGADISNVRDELNNVWLLADEQSKQINDLETQIEQLEVELQNAEFARLSVEDEKDDQLRAKNFEIESLKSHLSNAGQTQADYPVPIEDLLDLATRADEPTPFECLEVVEKVYGDRCIILDSAKKSARDMTRFAYGKRLLNLLRLLVTDYRSTLDARGDNEARKVFGRNEFAATESETVTSNPSLRRARTFDYQGQSVEMLRHLKIGVDDDIGKTIRVHFHWDSHQRLIVVGYCGEHLPILAR